MLTGMANMACATGALLVHDEVSAGQGGVLALMSLVRLATPSTSTRWERADACS